ncbi:siderophore-interacting protein [Actinokineospora sp. G85]|uniref:siderophore-interacting protein n=1 Tax=Actinokineospora sp. G85 TaxID=3406626 RepID=UPI003C70ACD7
MTAAVRERPPLAVVEAEVVAVARLTPRMRRITLGGPALVGYPGDHPGDAVKLVLPPTGAGEPPRATWGPDGLALADPDAEFALRTYTVRRCADGLMDIDAVLHGSGPGSTWARTAAVGDAAVLLGPRRDFPDDLSAGAPDLLLVAGDETAVPAAAGIAEALPAGARAVFVLEVDGPADEVAIESAGELTVTWVHRGSGSLVEAVRALRLPAGRVRAWAAAESGVAVELRGVLRREHGLSRGAVSAFGYWQRDRVAEEVAEVSEDTEDTQDTEGTEEHR